MCCLLVIGMQTIFCVNDGLGAIIYMMVFKHVGKSCLTHSLEYNNPQVGRFLLCMPSFSILNVLI
jgi:hypothetical protein